MDGVFLKRSWGGEVQNVSILVTIGVDHDGYREIIGAAEGMKEDKESWKNFFIDLKNAVSQASASSLVTNVSVCWSRLVKSIQKLNTSAVRFISTATYSRQRREK